MTDPVQLLIDAGAIPSAPFVPQSRYNGVPLSVLQLRPDTPRQVYVLRRFIPTPSTLAIAERHAVSALDRPDLLGAKHFGDPLLYWRIADANAVVDPNELTDTLGRRVDIPLPPGM
ncbi:MAG: Base plate wedge protein 53 [Betaproteobacteria bacterium]|nr:Base plate wedge protein 53 [Betaproteobacteria bacterium]